MRPFAKLCKCGAERDSQTNAWCRSCKAAYMRQWRKERIEPRISSADLDIRSLRQRRAQDTARQAKRRGRIAPQPCIVCGDQNAQMHHHDYTRPLDVVWLCSLHHTRWHQFWNSFAPDAFGKWLAAERGAIPRSAAKVGRSVAFQGSVRAELCE